MTRLGHVTSALLPRLNTCVWFVLCNKVFSLSTYWLRIKILFVFLLFVQSFVLGERCAYFHMHGKLTHKKEGLSQCISWAFSLTLTFDPHAQCGIQLSCSLK